MNHIHTIRVGEQEYPIGPVIDDAAATAENLWSAQKILQQLGALCPPISAQAQAVRCRPLESIPMQVKTVLPQAADSLTLTLCGKNLFDYTAYPFEDYLIYDAGGAANASSGFSAFRNYMPVAHLRGMTVTLNHPGAEKNSSTHAALAFYDGEKNFLYGSNGYSHTVPEDAVYMRFSVPREYADGTQVQLELGDQVTDYEPYRKEEFSAELPEPVTEHSWQPITAKGTCTLWSSQGETAVEAKADPVPLLQTLLNQEYAN